MRIDKPDFHTKGKREDFLITDYLALVDEIGKSDDPNKAEVYEAVERQMQHLMDYVAAVYAQTTQMPMLRKIYQGQELRERTAALGERRTIAHDSAIRACFYL